MTKREEFRVSGQDVVRQVKKIVQEGNARRIIIQNEQGKSIAEFPLTIGAIGTLLVPVLAAVGAIAALATNCTIVVEHRDKD